jgi:hypothetical protein
VHLYELLVCRRYYLEHDPSKVMTAMETSRNCFCKLHMIQGELGMLRGWLS